MDDDVSDVSDFDDSEVKSPRDSSGPNSQHNTPRGILKKVKFTLLCFILK